MRVTYVGLISQLKLCLKIKGWMNALTYSVRTRPPIRTMFDIKTTNYGVLWRHAYASKKNTRACACVYLSQHLDGSLMTLTFRGGRGRTKKQRVKKLLSNFVARVLSKTQSSFPYSLWHFFFLFMFQVSLYSTSTWSMRFAFRTASWDLWSLRYQCCRSDRK